MHVRLLFLNWRVLNKLCDLMKLFSYFSAGPELRINDLVNPEDFIGDPDRVW